MSPQPGTAVHGRYRVEKLLGQGGFGSAYLCSDLERFEAPCVLKELRTDTGASEKASELFEREAKVLLALSHPSIPTMHAFFELEGRYYLVQEFVNGNALNNQLRERGTFAEAQVRSILMQVLEILRYLHDRDPPVIHRDIKPGNLIVDGDGRAYLIDFGAVLEAMTRLQGEEATRIGTIGYTPIEQRFGAPEPASDIYALGATALHLLTGITPSEWCDPGTGGLKNLIGATGGSEQLERVLTKMMAEHPNDRFRTAGQVIDALTGDVTAPLPSGGQWNAAGPPTGESDLETVELQSTSASASSSLLGSEVLPPSGDVSQPLPVARRPRTSLKRRLGIGSGIVSGAVGAWIVFSAGRGAEEAVPEPIADPPPVTVESLPIPLMAQTVTNAGLSVSVNYPATWQLTTDASDTHLAVGDPESGTVFLAGMERSRGAQGVAANLATRLAADPGRAYGQIEVTEALTPGGDLVPFRLNVRRGGSVERGTLVLQQFTAGGDVFSLWWMTLGNDSTAMVTIDSMLQTLTTDAN